MAGSVNKVILVGNLGRDPEIRSMQSGSRVCNLSVATSESWKDRSSGERREKTEWHRVVVFNENLVNICERYLKKGSKVYLEGQIETRKWNDQASGQEKFSTEIVLRPFRGELTLLDGRSEGGGGMDRVPDYGEQGGGAAMAPSRSGGSGGAMGSGGGGRPSRPAEPSYDLDDEIPF